MVAFRAGLRAIFRQKATIARMLCLLAATTLLSGVAIANRSPLPFPDSRAYWLGGRAATEMGGSIAGRLLHQSPAARQPLDGAANANQSRNKLRSATGVRSIFYSVFAYGVGAALTPWGVVALQSMALALTMFLLARALVADRSAATYLSVTAGICALTAAPWVAAELLPDVFTGIVVALTIVLFLGSDAPIDRTFFGTALLLAFAITTHASHFALALLLAASCLVIGRLSGFSSRRVAALGFRLGLPLGGATAATLLVSFIGFHQVSLTPQSPPFLLARAIEDGPAREWLRTSCPGSGYVLCGSLQRIPNADADFVWNFLWAPNSIYMTATPDMRDQLRREQLPIVLAAAERYPLRQARASLRNLCAQLTEFGAHEFHLGGKIAIQNGQYTWTPGTTRGAVLDLVSVVQYLSVGLALALLAYVGFAVRDIAWRGAITLCVIGMLANAAICGILSEPSPRYEARVAWLPVALALLYAVPRLRARLAMRRPLRRPLLLSGRI